MDGNKHYIKVDANNNITEGYVDWQADKYDPNDILILEDGPRHFHQVWTEPLINERGQYRFKWINGERVERTQEELDAEYEARPKIPSTQEQINNLRESIISLMGL